MRMCEECKQKPMISGQAFTKYVCSLCGSENTWANTGVPKICLNCADVFDFCQRCLKRSPTEWKGKWVKMTGFMPEMRWNSITFEQTGKFKHFGKKIVVKGKVLDAFATKGKHKVYSLSAVFLQFSDGADYVYEEVPQIIAILPDKIEELSDKEVLTYAI